MKKQGERYSIAVDFDGVIHSYTSPWVNARTIPDPPVPGAMDFLRRMVEHFDVAIFSTRNYQFLGTWAMRRWLRRNLQEHFWDYGNAHGIFPAHLWTHGDIEDECRVLAADVLSRLRFPRRKPPALIYLDDRALRFAGSFPTKQEIHAARPWNKPKH